MHPQHTPTHTFVTASLESNRLPPTGEKSSWRNHKVGQEGARAELSGAYSRVIRTGGWQSIASDLIMEVAGGLDSG